MSEEPDYILETFTDETEETVATRRFPVLAQLSLLGLILAIIFGVKFIPEFIANSKGVDEATMQATPLIATPESLVSIKPIDNITIEGRAAFVYDIKGKKALYNKNADTVLPLASITKLMTALVAHELIDENKKINVSKNAIMQSGESGLTEGEIITAQALTDFSMLASSNDAAYALAAAVGAVIDKRSPNQTFVNAMNIRSDELGLNNLTFYNPTGLDESATQAGATGNAREVSFLMEYILDNYPSILEPSTFTSTRVYNEAGSYHAAENTNVIVSQIPNLLGSKTGYTDLAGGNLTIVFDAGFNRPIIVTVLGSSYDGRFTDVKKLVTAVTNSLKTAE